MVFFFGRGRGKGLLPWVLSSLSSIHSWSLVYFFSRAVGVMLQQLDVRGKSGEGDGPEGEVLKVRICGWGCDRGAGCNCHCGGAILLLEYLRAAGDNFGR